MQHPEAAEEIKAPPPELAPSRARRQLRLGRAAVQDAEDILVRHALDHPDGEEQSQEHGEPRILALVPRQPAEEEVLQVCRRREQDHRAAEPRLQIPLHLARERAPAEAPARDEAEQRDRQRAREEAEHRTEDRLEDEVAEDAGDDGHSGAP